MRHALIAGGAGFIGSHLVDSLLRQGDWRVTVIDNLITGDLKNLASAFDHVEDRFRMIRGNIVTYDFDADYHLDNVDVIYNLASPASPVAYEKFPIQTLRAGAEGTYHLLELAHVTGARFVLASTSEVYGDPAVHPQPEEYHGNVNPVGPRSMYDEAKRYAEAITTAARHDLGVNTGIVRIFNTYGPRMDIHDGRVVPAFITQAIFGEPLTVTGTGTQTRSLCYVGDLVRGLELMGKSAVNGPINLGNDHEITMLDLAQVVLEVEGRESRGGIRFIPRPDEDPERRKPVLTKAFEQLGWVPTTELRRGITQTMDWYRKELY